MEDVNMRTKFDETEDLEKFFARMSFEKQVYTIRYFKKLEGKSKEQRTFIRKVKKSYLAINYEYWIAKMEPSRDKKGRLYYKKGDPVANMMNDIEWLKLGYEFMPDMMSHIASEEEYILWLAYRIASGMLSLSLVCDDSSPCGNYDNSADAVGRIENAGARYIGGAMDGVGNSRKLVRSADNEFAIYGGSYGHYGYDYPIAYVEYCNFVKRSSEITGVIALRS